VRKSRIVDNTAAAPPKIARSMLVSFSVANFRSIGEEVTLNMVASNKLSDHEDHRVPIGDTGKFALRTAVLYGANAAGKSNLIKAMAYAQRLIREPGERRAPISTFRFSRAATKTSTFEFRFLLNDRVFVYGFDIEQEKFTGEWLAVMKGDDDVVLFERKTGTVDVPLAGRKQFQSDTQTFNILDALKVVPLRHDQLFLNRALSIPEDMQGATLRSILKWFTTDLIILPANSRSSDIIARLHDDSQFKVFCSHFLNNVGTGVGGLDLVLTEREMTEWERRNFTESSKFRSIGYDPEADIIPKPDNPGMVLIRKLFSEHHIHDGTYQLPFAEESDGTRSLLHLLPFLAASPEECRVVVIDELDRSLHPLICWEFVRFFSESCQGAPRQLIVTTHEAHLLNQELLRRDEYWFVEKDENQQTRLSSLVDFNIRNDLKVEKGYLSGRFGAIPLIGGMSNLEALLDCHHLEVGDAKNTPPAE
jgi:AAA15 family ATPase/GTPase